MSVEPNELGTLLQAAVGDPLGTLGRVAGQVLDQLLNPDTAIGAEPEALIASAITRRLTGFFAASEPDLVQDRHIPVDVRAAYFEELLTRNSSLAAALGACDCWGAAP